MRIYLTEQCDVIEILEGGSERKRSYPRAGFYANVPDDRAQGWIDDGIAFEATGDNMINAFRPGSDIAELIDLDAGDTLAGFYGTSQPLTEEDDPEETSEPVDDETGTDDSDLTGFPTFESDEGGD